MKAVSKLSLIICLWMILAPCVLGQTSTKEVSLRYLEVDAARDYDRLQTLYAGDATFFDPTGEVFEGDVALGVTTGAQAITDLQRTWGLTAVDFKPDFSFYSGEYALHRGTYKAKFEGSDGWVFIPFVTVHRVVDGLIQSRRDFGEYVHSFGLGNGFDANTSGTKSLADQYLQAYLDEDFDSQAAMMAENVTFQDPTAMQFGPESGNLFTNAKDLLAQRRAVFGNISDFGFDIESRFVSNHHAVYMGEITYTTASGAVFVQPAVFIIEVRDGKVTRHWDFVDYSVGPVTR